MKAFFLDQLEILYYSVHECLTSPLIDIYSTGTFDNWTPKTADASFIVSIMIKRHIENGDEK